MDKSFQRQESETKQPSGFLAGLHILDGILNWLSGLFRLTEEEQKDAGIDLGDRRET